MPLESGEIGSGRAGRRKKVTRDQTNTLKGWLLSHLDYPYPKREDKWILCVLTRLTMDQVSTWFANARRRLKKEKGATWNTSNHTKDRFSHDLKQTISSSTAKMPIKGTAVPEEEQIEIERDQKEDKECQNRAIDGRVLNVQPHTSQSWNCSHLNIHESYSYGKLR